MTIIPQDALSNDPQHLLFHFPGIHPVKYTKLSNDYHFWRAVDAAERTAAMFGRLLVPANCLHWQRKPRLEDRRVQIGKKAYYCLSKDEMTGTEFMKYSETATAREQPEAAMA